MEANRRHDWDVNWWSSHTIDINDGQYTYEQFV